MSKIYAYSRRGFSKNKSKAKFGRRVRRKSGGARKSIVKIVKGIISRQAENKAWFDYGVNQSIATATTSTPTNKNLIPLPAQGTGHSQRVGNEIRVKSGYVKGHVNILPYDATLNSNPLPVWVKIWILSCKSQNTTSLASTDIGNSLFDIVNSSVGLQGNMLDIDFTLNKEQWTCYGMKSFKLGVGAITSVGPVGTNSYYDNSPMSVPFYFNIGKHMKLIKFSDNTTPTNRNMFICFQVVPANGVSGSNQIPAEFHYSTRIEYEDI